MHGGERERTNHLAAIDLGDASPDLLCAVDGVGRFARVNRAWDRALGWSAGDLLGRPFEDFLVADEHVRGARRWVDRVRAGETVPPFEAPWPHHGGGQRWLSWTGTCGSDGLLYCSGRDVTEQMTRFVEVAHDAHLLAEAERAAGIGVWDWNIDEDRAYLSAGLCRILGLPTGRRIGFRELLDMVVPDDRARFEQVVVGSIRAGAPFDVEFRLSRPDGVEVAVWERGHPVVADGRTVRLYGTVRDVTEQRAVERGLRRAAELEQSAATRLRRVDLLKTSFLSAVSHELRTPMTVIHGMAETLQRGRDRLTAEQRAPLEDALVRHTSQFVALLRDLLDVDRLLRGRVENLPTPLELVTSIRHQASSSSVADRVVFDLPEELHVWADPLQVERIVANLLDNAHKYAPDGEVVVQARRAGEDGFRLTVADEGPGIDGSDLERIFTPFYRSHHRAPQPGTGIGLALVSSFATLHGGRAWAELRTPRGLAVHVEVPGPPPSATAEPALFDPDGG